MRILISRILAIWLLSLAIVCLVAPFRFYHEESVVRRAVRFTRIGFTDTPSSRATGRLVGAVPIRAEELAQFQTLREAVDERLLAESLQGREGDVTAPSATERILNDAGSFITLPYEEASAFLTAVSPDDWTDVGLIYRGYLFELESFAAAVLQHLDKLDVPESGQAVDMPVSFRLSGPTPLFAPDIAPELSPAVFASWPAGRAALEREVAGGAYRGENVALEKDWNDRLTGAGLAPRAYSRFVYEGCLFMAEPFGQRQLERVPHSSVWLVRLVGLVALVLGVRAGRGLYSRAEEWGTRTSTTGSLVAADAVLLLFATLAFVSCVDWLLSRGLGIESWFGDELLLTVSGAVILVLGVPLCAWLVTAQGMQQVAVDSAGVEVRGLGGRDRAAWSDIETIRVHEVLIPIRRVGVPVARRLMRTLHIDTGRTTVVIQEPSSKAAKLALLDRFEQHAPPELRDQIAEARSDWTSLS